MNGSSADTTRHSTHRGVLKSAAVVTVLTFVSRLLGLVREQVRSFYLGTGMGSDAFGLASTIPNLFRRLLGEGAMTAAFVPVLAGYLKKENRKELAEFLSSFLTLFTFITTALAVAGILLSDVIIRTFFTSGFGKVAGKLELTVVLTELMFPYLSIVCVAAIIQAVLNSFRIFAPSAATPALLNLAVIAAAWGLHGFFADPSFAFAIGFLAGGVCQLGFQIPWLRRLKLGLRFSLNWSHPGVRELLRVLLPGVFAAGIYQIDVFVSEMIAATLDQGSIAALQYSIRLQELVLGVFVISMTTVILPTLSKQMAAGDKDAFGETSFFALEVLALVTVPASVLLLVLRRPVVSLLFEQGEFGPESTDMTALAVLFHSLGVFFIATSRSLNQAFYAMKDLKTPTLVAAAAFLVNVTVCLTMSGPLRQGGIALGNSVSAAVTAGLLYVLLARRLGRARFLRYLWTLARVVAAGLAMGGLAWGVTAVLPPPAAGKLWLLAWVGMCTVISGLGFLAAGCVLLPRELGGLWRLVRRR